MVFHRTGSCNISEFSCEREVVRLTLGLHRGQESEQRSRLLSMAVPQAAGRRVGGEHPQQRAPCCPPPGGGPSACSSGRTRSAAGLWLKPEDSASWESVQTEGYVAGRCASVQAVHSSADDSVSGYLGSVHSHETSDISTCEHNRRAGDSLFINQSFGKR